MEKLDGKVAVVTGGSTGMGLATARLFVREGASVVITDRDQAALDAAARDIGNGVEAFRSDIAAVAALDALRVPKSPPVVDPPAPVEAFTDGAFTRREFIATTTAAVGAAWVAGHSLISPSTAFAAEIAPPAAVTAAPGNTADMVNVVLQVNGAEHALKLDPRVSLLDALREHLQLTGTKKGCDHGQCGACTVMAGGRRINSCLSLAVMHDGDSITTIEGLGKPGSLHPMQAAFIKHDGYQCGYCTPGQIMSAVATLREIADGIPSHVSADLVGKISFSEDEIRERMSGNICRCAAYANIIAAVREVAGNPT